MLNRYSLIFYITALIFTFVFKNIIALFLFVSGFIVAYIYSICEYRKEALPEQINFQDILLFKNKDELLKAIKNKETEDSKEKESKKNRKVNIRLSIVFISIYVLLILFFAYVFKNSNYLLFLLLSPLLIVIEEE